MSFVECLTAPCCETPYRLHPRGMISVGDTVVITDYSRNVPSPSEDIMNIVGKQREREFLNKWSVEFINQPNVFIVTHIIKDYGKYFVVCKFLKGVFAGKLIVAESKGLMLKP